MQPVYITHTATFLPNGPITNDRVEAVLGEIPNQPARVKQFVLANNGITSRYYAIDPTTGERTHNNAQLAAAAIRALLAEAGVAEDALEGLACGTSSPDQIIPSHANMVAGELGLAPTEIVSNAGVCASGMAALKYGYMNVALGQSNQFVVSGSECASASMVERQYRPLLERLNQDVERSAMVSFEKEFLRWMLSDGAGAVLLEAAPRAGATNLLVEDVVLRSWAGQLPVCMYAGMNKDRDGHLTHWYEEEDIGSIPHKGYLLLQQDVRALEAHMVDVAVAGLRFLVETRRLDLDAIDWFLPHLSSMYFKAPLMERFEAEGLGIPEHKWFTNLTEKGNTGSASIFIILDELVRSGRLTKGQRILCAVPESARFTMAGMVLRVC